MSTIDLSNPQVLKNWLRSQMKEGKGEFSYKERVLVFKMSDGSEYVAPSELAEEFEIQEAKTGTAVSPENPILETPVVLKKKSKKTT